MRHIILLIGLALTGCAVTPLDRYNMQVLATYPDEYFQNLDVMTDHERAEWLRRGYERQSKLNIETACKVGVRPALDKEKLCGVSN